MSCPLHLVREAAAGCFCFGSGSMPPQLLNYQRFQPAEAQGV